MKEICRFIILISSLYRFAEKADKETASAIIKLFYFVARLLYDPI